jgi:hypothetical protein
MSSPWQKYSLIMLFYIFLSYIVVPGIAYQFMGKTIDAAGKGFVVGSVVSILLWQFVGKKMV